MPSATYAPSVTTNPPASTPKGSHWSGLASDAATAHNPPIAIGPHTRDDADNALPAPLTAPMAPSGEERLTMI